LRWIQRRRKASPLVEPGAEIDWLDRDQIVNQPAAQSREDLRELEPEIGRCPAEVDQGAMPRRFTDRICGLIHRLVAPVEKQGAEEGIDARHRLIESVKALFRGRQKAPCLPRSPGSQEWLFPCSQGKRERPRAPASCHHRRC
jgi:hypothetical protein